MHGNGLGDMRQEHTDDKAGKQFWDELWDELALPEAVDPRSTRLGNLFNRRVDALIRRILANMSTEGLSLLEVGCGRSAWLAYFHREFGFDVSGLDYSDIGCDQARLILANAGVPGDIVRGDLFSPPEHLLESFDVVWSFGVVEHFVPTSTCVRACGALLKSGGTMITVVPNLTGVPGALQRMLSRSIYDVHVPLRAEQLALAHREAGLSLVECGYFLSSGFGVLRPGADNPPPLSQRIKGRGLRLLEGGSVATWWLEDRTRQLPATRRFAPFIVCIAEKP